MIPLKPRAPSQPPEVSLNFELPHEAAESIAVTFTLEPPGRVDSGTRCYRGDHCTVFTGSCSLTDNVGRSQDKPKPVASTAKLDSSAKITAAASSTESCLLTEPPALLDESSNESFNDGIFFASQTEVVEVVRSLSVQRMSSVDVELESESKQTASAGELADTASSPAVETASNPAITASDPAITASSPSITASDPAVETASLPAAESSSQADMVDMVVKLNRAALFLAPFLDELITSGRLEPAALRSRLVSPELYRCAMLHVRELNHVAEEFNARFPPSPEFDPPSEAQQSDGDKEETNNVGVQTEHKESPSRLSIASSDVATSTASLFASVDSNSPPSSNIVDIKEKVNEELKELLNASNKHGSEVRNLKPTQVLEERRQKSKPVEDVEGRRQKSLEVRKAKLSEVVEVKRQRSLEAHKRQRELKDEEIHHGFIHQPTPTVEEHRQQGLERKLKSAEEKGQNVSETEVLKDFEVRKIKHTGTVIGTKQHGLVNKLKPVEATEEGHECFEVQVREGNRPHKVNKQPTGVTESRRHHNSEIHQLKSTEVKEERTEHGFVHKPKPTEVEERRSVRKSIEQLQIRVEEIQQIVEPVASGLAGGSSKTRVSNPTENVDSSSCGKKENIVVPKCGLRNSAPITNSMLRMVNMQRTPYGFLLPTQHEESKSKQTASAGELAETACKILAETASSPAIETASNPAITRVSNPTENVDSSSSSAVETAEEADDVPVKLAKEEKKQKRSLGEPLAFVKINFKSCDETCVPGSAGRFKCPEVVVRSAGKQSRFQEDRSPRGSAMLGNSSVLIGQMIRLKDTLSQILEGVGSGVKPQTSERRTVRSRPESEARTVRRLASDCVELCEKVSKLQPSDPSLSTLVVQGSESTLMPGGDSLVSARLKLQEVLSEMAQNTHEDDKQRKKASADECKRSCCARTRPHCHGSINGVPVVIRYDKRSDSAVAQVGVSQSEKKASREEADVVASTYCRLVPSLPVQVQRAQVPSFPVEVNKTQALLMPAEINKTQVPLFPVEGNKTEVSSFPIDVNKAQVPSFPVEVNKTEVPSFSVEVNKARVPSFPVDVNKTQVTSMPVEINKTEVASSPVEIIKTQVLSMPAEINKIQAPLMPAEINNTQAASFPVEINKPQASSMPAEINKIEVPTFPLEMNKTLVSSMPSEVNKTEVLSMPLEMNQSHIPSLPAEINRVQVRLSPVEINRSHLASVPEEANGFEDHPPQEEGNLAEHRSLLSRTDHSFPVEVNSFRDEVNRAQSRSFPVEPNRAENRTKTPSFPTQMNRAQDYNLPRETTRAQDALLQVQRNRRHFEAISEGEDVSEEPEVFSETEETDAEFIDPDNSEGEYLSAEMRSSEVVYSEDDFAAELNVEEDEEVKMVRTKSQKTMTLKRGGIPRRVRDFDDEATWDREAYEVTNQNDQATVEALAQLLEAPGALSRGRRGRTLPDPRPTRSERYRAEREARSARMTSENVHTRTPRMEPHKERQLKYLLRKIEREAIAQHMLLKEKMRLGEKLGERVEEEKVKARRRREEEETRRRIQHEEDYLKMCTELKRKDDADVHAQALIDGTVQVNNYYDPSIVPRTRIRQKFPKVPEGQLQVPKVPEGQLKMPKVPERQSKVRKASEEKSPIRKFVEEQAKLSTAHEGQTRVAKFVEEQVKFTKGLEGRSRSVERQAKVAMVSEEKPPIRKFIEEPAKVSRPLEAQSKIHEEQSKNNDGQSKIHGEQSKINEDQSKVSEETSPIQQFIEEPTKISDDNETETTDLKPHEVRPRVPKFSEEQAKFSRVHDVSSRVHRVLRAKPRAPRVTESHPRAPRVTESYPRASRVMESNPRAPRVTETHQRPPRVMESLPNAPRVLESHPRAPRVTESYPRAPRVMESHLNAPRVMETQPRTPKVLEKLPRAVEKTKKVEPKEDVTPKQTVAARVAVRLATLATPRRLSRSSERLRQRMAANALRTQRARSDAAKRQVMVKPQVEAETVEEDEAVEEEEEEEEEEQAAEAIVQAFRTTTALQLPEDTLDAGAAMLRKYLQRTAHDSDSDRESVRGSDSGAPSVKRRKQSDTRVAKVSEGKSSSRVSTVAEAAEEPDQCEKKPPPRSKMADMNHQQYRRRILEQLAEREKPFGVSHKPEISHEKKPKVAPKSSEIKKPARNVAPRVSSLRSRNVEKSRSPENKRSSISSNSRSPEVKRLTQSTDKSETKSARYVGSRSSNSRSPENKKPARNVDTKSRGSDYRQTARNVASISRSPVSKKTNRIVGKSRSPENMRSSRGAGPRCTRSRSPERSVRDGLRGSRSRSPDNKSSVRDDGFRSRSRSPENKRSARNLDSKTRNAVEKKSAGSVESRRSRSRSPVPRKVSESPARPRGITSPSVSFFVPLGKPRREAQGFAPLARNLARKQTRLAK